jgi:hypothetical protein
MKPENGKKEENACSWRKDVFVKIHFLKFRFHPSAFIFAHAALRQDCAVVEEH